MRALAKSVLRGSAALLGPHRWRTGPALAVLTYHRVLPLDHPARATEQPGMLVTPELLAMHIEVLRKHFSPVHLDDWLRAAKAGEPPPGRSLAITFDDGWRDNFDYAFPVLESAGMPATLFVVTDMVGSRYRFWPNRLASALKAWRPVYANRLEAHTRRSMVSLGIPLDVTGAEVMPEQIDAAICRCKAANDATMHALLDRVEAVLPEQSDVNGGQGMRDLLDWEELCRMTESDLVRIGSHTRRHTRLRDELSPEQLDDEVGGSRRILEQKLGRPAPLFCYPNGDCSPRAYAAVSGAYEAAVSTRRGWHTARRDPYMVRRIGVHEDVSGTPAHILARVSGWPGV